MVGPYLASGEDGCQGQSGPGLDGSRAAAVAPGVGRHLHPVAADRHRAPAAAARARSIAEVEDAPRIRALPDGHRPALRGQVGHGPRDRGQGPERLAPWRGRSEAPALPPSLTTRKSIRPRQEPRPLPRSPSGAAVLAKSTARSPPILMNDLRIIVIKSRNYVWIRIDPLAESTNPFI